MLAELDDPLTASTPLSFFLSGTMGRCFSLSMINALISRTRFRSKLESNVAPITSSRSRIAPISYSDWTDIDETKTNHAFSRVEFDFHTREDAIEDVIDTERASGQLPPAIDRKTLADLIGSVLLSSQTRFTLLS